MTFVQAKMKSKLEKISLIFGLSLLMILMVAAGSISCKKEAVEEEAHQEAGTVLQKGVNEFEGVVKVGIGKYFYMPGAQGIDMVAQGQIDSGDTGTIVGKEVRVKGEFSPERPSILIIEAIDVKEDQKQWKNVFAKTEDAVVDDYLDLKARDEFAVLKNLNYKKKEEWEGKGKVKVYGKLGKTTITQGEKTKDVYNIMVLGEKGEELGKILVDNITDFAEYYLKKLWLFDKFWNYINIKETVDWKVRGKTKELFHADLLFAGLF